MSTYMTREFIDAVRAKGYTVTIDGRTLTLRGSSARGAMGTAELEVTEGTSIVGYITPYGDNEHGAVGAQLFQRIAPVVFRELEPALRRILQEQPRN